MTQGRVEGGGEAEGGADLLGQTGHLVGRVEPDAERLEHIGEAAWLEADQLPCLTTRAPAPAATIAAIVEMLTLIERSPPVPTTSSARPGSSAASPTSYIASRAESR